MMTRAGAATRAAHKNGPDEANWGRDLLHSTQAVASSGVVVRRVHALMQRPPKRCVCMQQEQHGTIQTQQGSVSQRLSPSQTVTPPSTYGSTPPWHLRAQGNH